MPAWSRLFDGCPDRLGVRKSGDSRVDVTISVTNSFFALHRADGFASSGRPDALLSFWTRPCEKFHKLHSPSPATPDYMANIFPRWSNLLHLKIAFCAGTAAAGVVLAFIFYATPKSLVTGYQPSQPIPFSHKIHVDQIGLDCRYCHSFVDVSGHSNVP